MKKLTLNTDDLKVHSFATAQVDGEAGTVHGAATTVPCGGHTNWWTCGIYCPQTTDPKSTGPCAC